MNSVIDADDLLELLCCPACRGQLQFTSPGPDEAEARLICENCPADYKIQSGIPDLVPNSIELDNGWDVWRDHLAAFQKRRTNREADPTHLVNLMSRSGAPQQIAFARFTGITDGLVLDVGCGPGKFRFNLPEAVDYIGMDPTPLPEAVEFPFVRAIAENIPLPDNTVRHITVLSALDHFKDCSAFLQECLRVLEPDGRLHIVQQIHEHGPSIRATAHWLKDLLEDRTTKHDDEIPHHMTEFDRDDLHQTLDKYFTMQAEETYSMSFYTPRRLFMTLAPR